MIDHVDSVSCDSVNGSGASSDKPLTAMNECNLLDLPLEIRRMVYSHFLQLDLSLGNSTMWVRPMINKFGTKNWTDSFDFRLLQINRQLRRECWDFFITKNVWIRCTLVEACEASEVQHADSNKKGFTLCQPVILPELFPKHVIEQLDQSLALHITIQDQNGHHTDSFTHESKKVYSFTFAYHPGTYSFFCNVLGGGGCFKKMVILDLNHTVTGHTTPEDLICPLRAIRDAGAVKLENKMRETHFRKLVSQMTIPIASDKESYSVLKTYIDAAEQAASKDNLLSALLCYLAGEQRFSFSLGPDRVRHKVYYGSPENNDLRHIFCDIKIRLVAMANKYIDKGREHREEVGVFEFFLLTRALNSAAGALSWPGITDEQRMNAHYERARAISHIIESELREYLTMDAKDDLETTQIIMRYKELAARDFFFAQDIGVVEEVRKAARRRWIDIDKRLELSQNLFETIKHDIPIFGSWSGDRRVLEEWGEKVHLMFMLRRRSWDLGLPLTNDELRARYRREGLAIRFKADGSVSFKRL